MSSSPAFSSTAVSRHDVISRSLWIVGFAALTAAAAQFEVQHYPVPYTLQTMFVLLSGAILGKRAGALSQIAYLLAGIVGIPVFAGLTFGLAKIAGPTGGYLLSFPVAAFVVGYLLEQKTSLPWTIMSMITGMFIIFSLGTLHLNMVYFHDWSASIAGGFLLFSWWDGIKIFAAALIAVQFKKRM